MARQHSYWVILSGSTATAFRSGTRDALLPTFRQLQRTQKDVSLRWFENGRVWDSPEAARAAVVAARFARRQRGQQRSASWRPGGDHIDRRAKYQLSRDEKRARFKQRLRSGSDRRRPPKKRTPE